MQYRVIAANWNGPALAGRGCEWSLAVMSAEGTSGTVQEKPEPFGILGELMEIRGVTTGSADTFSTAGRQVIASYASYAEAERAVDYLSDAAFLVEYTDIVGRDLRLVERVTGRMTNVRAAAAGAGTGAWFGLFIGLLVGLVTPGPVWLGMILGGLVIGALSGVRG